MILNNLSPEIELQVFELLGDDQFTKQLSEDKVIDYLQAQKHDSAIESQELQLLLKRKNMFNNIAFKPITLALLSYLYTIKSNIIFDMNKINKTDLDIFFYLLQTKNYTYNIEQLFQQSEQYCKRKLNLSYTDSIKIFNKLYYIEFKVFSLFPRTNGEGVEIHLNVDWIINIISKIKSYVSYSTQELYTQVSVMQIYYYYAWWCRNNGDNSIILRDEQEILDEIDSRTIEIIVERLIQKKILKIEQKEEYFNLMKYSKKESEK